MNKIKKMVIITVVLINLAILLTLAIRYFQTCEQYEIKSSEISQLESKIEKPIIDIVTPEALHDVLRDHAQSSVLFFHKNGCSWCKKMEPVFQDIAKNPIFAQIQFYSANGNDCHAVDLVKKLAGEQISGYPFLLFFNKNGFLDKQVGFSNQKDFEIKIKRVFSDLSINELAIKTNDANVEIQCSTCGGNCCSWYGGCCSCDAKNESNGTPCTANCACKGGICCGVCFTNPSNCACGATCGVCNICPPSCVIGMGACSTIKPGQCCPPYTCAPTNIPGQSADAGICVEPQ